MIRSTTSAVPSRTISFSPLIRVSIVSGEASAVLIKSLFSTIGAPLSRVSSIIALKLLRGGYRRRAGKVKRLGKMKTKCPGWDTNTEEIKFAGTAPKKGPDAAVTEPEAATQGW